MPSFGSTVLNNYFKRASNKTKSYFSQLLVCGMSFYLKVLAPPCFSKSWIHLKSNRNTNLPNLFWVLQEMFVVKGLERRWCTLLQLPLILVLLIQRLNFQLPWCTSILVFGWGFPWVIKDAIFFLRKLCE